MLDQLYTIKDAAQYFHLSEKTIRNFLSDGILTGFKAGRDWRFLTSDFKQAEERLRQRTMQQKEAQAQI